MEDRESYLQAGAAGRAEAFSSKLRRRLRRQQPADEQMPLDRIDDRGSKGWHITSAINVEEPLRISARLHILVQMEEERFRDRPWSAMGDDE